MANIILKVVILFIFMLASIVILTIGHENVHKEIFSKYGIDSEIKIHYFKGWFTGTMGDTTPLNNFENCKDSCRLSNNMTEIIGYHLGTFVVIIFAILFAFLFIKEVDDIEKENERFINPLSLC